MSIFLPFAGQPIPQGDPSPVLQGSSKSKEYISHVGKGDGKSEYGALFVPGFLKKVVKRLKGSKGIIISISNLFQVD